MEHSAVTEGFTLLADLFISTASQLHWEEFSHATITAQRLFIHNTY